MSDVDSKQRDNKHKPMRYYTPIKEPVEELKKKIEAQHNLQNQKKAQLKWFAKEDN
jgi:hypothetical protein